VWAEGSDPPLDSPLRKGVYLLLSPEVYRSNPLSRHLELRESEIPLLSPVIPGQRDHRDVLTQTEPGLWWRKKSSKTSSYRLPAMRGLPPSPPS
jgi:hypothetical protein